MLFLRQRYGEVFDELEKHWCGWKYNVKPVRNASDGQEIQGFNITNKNIYMKQKKWMISSNKSHTSVAF